MYHKYLANRPFSFVAASLGQQAPTISISEGATYSVPENTTSVTSFTVSPSDATVALTTGTGLSLSGSDGSYSIAFDTAPDFDTLTEAGRSIAFTVTATDATDASLTTTVTGTVNVTDVDEPPTDIGGDPPAAVEEVITGTTTQTASATLTATDPEGRGISWSISGSDAAYFTINNEGALSFSVDNPDYEAKSSYSVTVTATDDGGQQKMRTITVPVTNVEEPGVVTFEPTSVRAGQKVTAKVTDPDAPSGITGVITWSWTGIAGTNPGNSASYTTVAGDAGETLTATVTYLDAAAGNADTANASITILAAENSDPVIVEPTSPTTTVAEDSDAAFEVGQYSATDVDTADTLTFTLEGADSSFFAIAGADDARTGGALTFTPPEDGLDYETKTSYSVTLKVTDGNGGSATTSVTVTVTNVDEPGVVTFEPTSVRAGGTVTAKVTDPDAPSGITGVITWSWTNITGTDPGNEPSYTTVATDVGASLPPTATATYFDAAGTTADTASASITVLAAENSDPVITEPNSPTTTVLESATAAFTVGDYTATDADNDTLTFTLEGDDSALFSIANENEGGALTFTPPEDGLDYETKTSYSATVKVSDEHGGSATASVTVTVTNVDEDGEVTFEPTSVRAGQTVTASVTDPDAPGGITGVVTWNWVGINGTAPTSTAPTSSYQTVDADVGVELTVTASYYDGTGTDLDTATATVTVLPAANNPPVVRSNSGRTSITVDETDGEVNPNLTASSFSAIDTDTVDLEWSVNGDDAAVFSITPGETDSKTAVLAFTSPPDFESGKTSYSVTVTASDGTDSGSIDMTINIRDANDPGVVTFSPEEFGVGQTVTAMLADDDVPLSDVTWAWTGVNDTDNAASASYTAVDGDSGSALTATATYTDRHGSGQTADGETMLVQAIPVDIPGVVTLSLTTLIVGDTVTATLEDANGGVTDEVWSWERSSNGMYEPISGAASNEYTVGLDDEGKRLRAAVMYTDATGTGKTAMAVLESPVDISGVVTLMPTALKVDEAVTATLEDADGGVTDEVWSWERSSNGTYETIAGAASNEYTATSGDVGKRLRAAVMYTDAHGTGKTAMSEASQAVAAAPVVTTPTTPTPPTQPDPEPEPEPTNPGVVTLSPSTLKVDQTVTAALADADGGVTDEVWSWQRSSNGTYVTIPGATSNQYTATEDDVGKRLRATVTYTDRTGTGNSATSDASGVILGTQKPDLIVDRPTVSKNTLASAEEFTLSATVKNEGTGQSVATTLRYYRSTNATITTSDTEVGSDSVAALEANGTRSMSITLTAPDAVGTYYYGACVDSVANESDTTNNCSAAVSVTVDALIPTLSVSTPSPLTEEMLDGSQVMLTLNGGTFEQTVATEAVTVSGIDGVTVETVTRVSDTEISVVLAFDGTDFDTDAQLTFSVGADAIANYTGSPLADSPSIEAILEPEPLFIYWIDRGSNSIRGASVNGSRVESLVAQGFTRPRGLAIDVADGKMYWTDYDSDKIQRAELDGSNVEDLVTQGLMLPQDIAVASNKMYWTDSATDKIQRADLDGSNVEDIVTQGLRIPKGLALDTAGGKMYWTDDGTNKIQRADLDGSDVEDLVTQGLAFPLDIALDVEGGKMYWTDVVAGKIQRADLDGSHVEDLVTGLSSPHSIAVDAADGKMYWTDWRTDKIQRANLDGSSVQDIVTSGIDSPAAIAIGSSSVQPPVATMPDDEDDEDDETVYADEDVNRDGSVDAQDIIDIITI